MGKLQTAGLTEKENAVLKSMAYHTVEYGLPVDTESIQNDTELTKRGIAGVVSSLYKKGFVEEYDLSEEDEFMLSEKAFEEYCL